MSCPVGFGGGVGGAVVEGKGGEATVPEVGAFGELPGSLMPPAPAFAAGFGVSTWAGATLASGATVEGGGSFAGGGGGFAAVEEADCDGSGATRAAPRRASSRS